MKKLISALLLGLMLGNVAYAQKVKLFDLSKHELEAKDKGKIETYQVGDIVLKTDLVYNKNKMYHEKGSKLILSRQNSFDNMSLIYKRFESNRNGRNVYITITDEFGEVVKISNNYQRWHIGDKEFKFLQGEETLKLVFKNKELLFFRNSELLEKLSLAHFNNVQNIQLNFDDENEIVYDLKVLAEN